MLKYIGSSTILFFTLASAKLVYARDNPAQPSFAERVQPLVDQIPPVLSEKQFTRLHALIRPQKGECQFLDIDWEPTVWDARIRAAREGKPILIWYMVGEPLGQC